MTTSNNSIFILLKNMSKIKRLDIETKLFYDNYINDFSDFAVALRNDYNKVQLDNNNFELEKVKNINTSFIKDMRIMQTKKIDTKDDFVVFKRSLLYKNNDLFHDLSQNIRNRHNNFLDFENLKRDILNEEKKPLLSEINNNNLKRDTDVNNFTLKKNSDILKLKDLKETKIETVNKKINQLEPVYEKIITNLNTLREKIIKNRNNVYDDIRENHNNFNIYYNKKILLLSSKYTKLRQKYNVYVNSKRDLLKEYYLENNNFDKQKLDKLVNEYKRSESVHSQDIFDIKRKIEAYIKDDRNQFRKIKSIKKDSEYINLLDKINTSNLVFERTTKKYLFRYKTIKNNIDFVYNFYKHEISKLNYISQHDDQIHRKYNDLEYTSLRHQLLLNNNLKDILQQILSNEYNYYIVENDYYQEVSKLEYQIKKMRLEFKKLQNINISDTAIKKNIAKTNFAIQKSLDTNKLSNDIIYLKIKSLMIKTDLEKIKKNTDIVIQNFENEKNYDIEKANNEVYLTSKQNSKNSTLDTIDANITNSVIDKYINILKIKYNTNISKNNLLLNKLKSFNNKYIEILNSIYTNSIKLFELIKTISNDKNFLFDEKKELYVEYNNFIFNIGSTIKKINALFVEKFRSQFKILQFNLLNNFENNKNDIENLFTNVLVELKNKIFYIEKNKSACNETIRITETRVSNYNLSIENHHKNNKKTYSSINDYTNIEFDYRKNNIQLIISKRELERLYIHRQNIEKQIYYANRDMEVLNQTYKKIEFENNMLYDRQIKYNNKFFENILKFFKKNSLIKIKEIDNRNIFNVRIYNDFFKKIDNYIKKNNNIKKINKFISSNLDYYKNKYDIFSMNFKKYDKIRNVYNNKIIKINNQFNQKVRNSLITNRKTYLKSYQNEINNLKHVQNSLIINTSNELSKNESLIKNSKYKLDRSDEIIKYNRNTSLNVLDMQSRSNITTALDSMNKSIKVIDEKMKKLTLNYKELYYSIYDKNVKLYKNYLNFYEENINDFNNYKNDVFNSIDILDKELVIKLKKLKKEYLKTVNSESNITKNKVSRFKRRDKSETEK